MRFWNVLIGAGRERDSAIVQYPSETTSGMLYIILTVKKHTHEKFQIGAAAEKGCEGHQLTGDCRVWKILYLVSLAKKSQEELQILSINTDETSTMKGKEQFI